MSYGFNFSKFLAIPSTSFQDKAFTAASPCSVALPFDVHRFEQRNGNCRLMADIACQLSETADMWRRYLAPFAEGIARSLWDGIAHKRINRGPATRLTQTTMRNARGFSISGRNEANPITFKLCLICGEGIKSSDTYCHNCVPTVSRENFLKAAKLGRLATHTPEAEVLRAATQRRQVAARKAWNPKDKPDWLGEDFIGKKSNRDSETSLLSR